MDTQRKKSRIDRDLAEEMLAHLTDLEESGILVIVEGKKDKEALLSLGLSQVFSLDRMALFRAVEMISKRTEECIILTDLDAEGKKLYGKLNHDLSQRGIRIDNTFREFLFRHTTLRQMEGMPRYLVRIGGPESKF